MALAQPDGSGGRSTRRQWGTGAAQEEDSSLPRVLGRVELARL